jgi:hypothetical protein
MGYEIQEKSLEESWQKVSSYEYIEDLEHYWKSPKEFFTDGGGDCEDFAIALIYLLGPDASFVCTDWNPGKHAIVKYNNKYLEPQNYNLYLNNVSVVYELDYYNIMEIATRKGTKNL